jgi:integrase
MTVWKTKYGWRYQFMHKRQEYSKSGFKTKAEALAAEAKKRKEVKSAKTSEPEPKQLDFASLAIEYLEWGERRFAAKTWKYKRYVFNEFMQQAGNLPLADIKIPVLESYLSTRHSNTNYNRHRKDLCALLVWGWKRGFIKENPCFFMEKLPEPKYQRVIPTPEEMSRIFLASGGDRPFLLVLYYTMARLDEILRLRWEDVNFENRWIRLWTRKRKGGGWEAGLMPMEEGLYEVLWGLWRKKEHAEWVFPNPTTGTRYNHRPRLMRGICKRAGVRHFGFHAIRHFVASYLADKAKVSMARIKPLLRHKSLRTTEIYLQRIDSNMREVMAKVPRPENLGDFLKTFPQQNQANLKKLVGTGGFEPPASCSQSRRANQTALRPEPL